MRPWQRRAGKTSGHVRSHGCPRIRWTLERHLGAHRQRVELRTGVGEVGGAQLLGDVAVQIVEHQADVAADVPVQRQRIDRLPAAGDAGRRADPVVEIDRAVPARDLPGAQPPPVNKKGSAGAIGL